VSKSLLAGIALLGCLALSGCNAGTVSQGDQEAVRKEMGTEAYEEAMRKAGRGAELEAQKKADAERMQGGG
jgi:hypothetical protein